MFTIYSPYVHYMFTICLTSACLTERACEANRMGEITFYFYMLGQNCSSLRFQTFLDSSTSISQRMFQNDLLTRAK